MGNLYVLRLCFRLNWSPASGAGSTCGMGQAVPARSHGERKMHLKKQKNIVQALLCEQMDRSLTMVVSELLSVGEKRRLICGKKRSSF